MRLPSGKTIIDNHGVLTPADLVHGRYQLRIGLRDLTNPNAHLPIQIDIPTVNVVQINQFQTLLG